MACAAVKFIQFCATEIHSPHVSASHLHQCFRFVIKVGPKSVNYEFRGCCRPQNISNPDKKSIAIAFSFYCSVAFFVRFSNAFDAT